MFAFNESDYRATADYSEEEMHAALAAHLMTNTALTGATYNIDGGQHLVET